MASQITTPLDLRDMTTTDKLSTEGWAWNNETKTLTLDGLDLASSTEKGIIMPSLVSSKIILVPGSVNKITTSDGNDRADNRGIQAAGDLAIVGEGKLDIIAAKGSSSIGIEVRETLKIGIADGWAFPVINATGGEAPGNISIGISANNFDFYSGKTTAKGNTVSGRQPTAFNAYQGVITLHSPIRVSAPEGAAISTISPDANKAIMNSR